MVRRTYGLFRGIDLENADSVRDFVNAVASLMNWHPLAPRAQTGKLYIECHDEVFFPAAWVTQKMNDSPLLSRMIEDFIVYSNGISDVCLVSQAHVLERFAGDVHAQTPWFKDTYAKAEVAYDEYLANGTLPEPYRTAQEQAKVDLARKVEAFYAEEQRIDEEERRKKMEIAKKKRNSPVRPGAGNGRKGRMRKPKSTSRRVVQ